MAECILIGNGSGGDIPLMTRLEWDALSTAQKRSYDLVAIQDSSTGFERGILVNGRDYIPKGYYIPNSDPLNIICEAHANNFAPDTLDWGVGDSPVTFNLNGGSVYPSLQQDDSVFIPVKTNNIFASVDLGSTGVPCTAYIVAKTVNATTYSRILSAFANRSKNGGIMLCGSDVDIESWDNSTFTGISSADYFVGAIQFVSQGTARGYVKGYANNPVIKPPNSIGRYITIGRTDINVSTTYAEPCDIYVKYVAVVSVAETAEVVSANLDALYNSFIS